MLRLSIQRVLYCVLALATLAALVGCSTVKPRVPSTSQFTGESFRQLLETLATGWNTNDASLAASVFAEDAVYVEPPDKQLYVGKEAIYEFFGGENGRDDWMRMQWHNVAFNEVEQVGSGEFTFSWDGGQVHGMVSVTVRRGKIELWREYFYDSDLNWDEFTRPSRPHE